MKQILQHCLKVSRLTIYSELKKYNVLPEVTRDIAELPVFKRQLIILKELIDFSVL